MKIVKVQYTTRPEYAAKNVENITNVANEVKSLNHQGIKYAAFLLPDGKTFMHFDQFVDEEAHNILTGLESFKKFAAELDASLLESEPKLDLLTSVATSYQVLG
ncbi:MAG: hypothetical protein ACHQHN_01115 [Sphingobacteriales bacterium]